MRFEERDDGDFHIYAGVIEAGWGEGYHAALVINLRGRRAGDGEEIFRDDALARRRQWPTSDAALRYALRRGQQVVHAHREAQRADALRRDNAGFIDRFTDPTPANRSEPSQPLEPLKPSPAAGAGLSLTATRKAPLQPPLTTSANTPATTPTPPPPMPTQRVARARSLSRGTP